MSKQTNSPLDQDAIRRRLLVTVSTIALLAGGTQSANAADADRPLLWIEFGGDAMAVSGEGQPFTAPFMSINDSSLAFNPLSPTEIQKPSRYSFGEEASITFQPEDSDWIFSAALRYGRSSNRRAVHQQTAGLLITPSVPIYPTVGSRLTAAQTYADYHVRHSEKHTIIDFSAGKDVGLGMFGTSEVNLGIRMARFDSTASVDMKVRPAVHLFFYSIFKYWHNYALDGSSARSFNGIGPSISWNDSVPLAGNLGDGELALDWGINAALLFGKQKAKLHHDTVAQTYHQKYGTYTQYHNSKNPSRSRNVTVPNVGGSVAISYKFNDAKLSLGYRYDTFLGAMDTGIDTAKKSNLTFNGPYASISIGLGD